jgi:hypothetical protein
MRSNTLNQNKEYSKTTHPVDPWRGLARPTPWVRLDPSWVKQDPPWVLPDPWLGWVSPDPRRGLGKNHRWVLPPLRRLWVTLSSDFGSPSPATFLPNTASKINYNASKIDSNAIKLVSNASKIDFNASKLIFRLKT